MQEFKVACADENYSKVLEFLRTDEYKIRNMFLKDIDVTMDYAGSFNKDEIVNYLTRHKGFRIQGSYYGADRTFWITVSRLGRTA